MKFTTKIYHVVGIIDFLNYLVKVDKNLSGIGVDDLLMKISDSQKVTFGDAIDTILSVQDICDILDCDVPPEVNNDMLIGLGS